MTWITTPTTWPLRPRTWIFVTRFTSVTRRAAAKSSAASAPHGMPATQADTINADLLAFFRS